MAFTGRPWAVKGSKTPSDIARIVAGAAVNFGNGVMGIGHCQVVALPTPTSKVRIYPGIVVVRNTYPGALYQNYIDINDGALDIDVPNNLSSGTRTDWVCYRIEDPQYPGQNAPADQIYGPYGRVVILSSDPRVTYPGFPCVLLAKLTIPAGATQITSTMINSGAGIREMANPLSAPVQLSWNGRLDGNTSIRANELTNVNGVTATYWLKNETTAKYLRWEVPIWAGQLNVQYTFGNVYNNRYDCWGWCGVRMVDPSNSANYVNLPAVDWDTTTDDPGRWSRDTWTGAGRIIIPSWARGKTVEFRPIATKTGGNQTAAKVYLGAGASFSLGGTFMQSAVDDIQ